MQYGTNQEATLGEIAVKCLEINEINRHLDHGQKILDVGCGNGYTTKIFAKKYNSKLHGIDSLLNNNGPIKDYINLVPKFRGQLF